MKEKPASLKCLQRASHVARIISYCDSVHLMTSYYRSFVAFSRQKLDVQPNSAVCSTPFQDIISSVCVGPSACSLFFHSFVRIPYFPAFVLYRLFIRPSIGASVPAFSRPSVFRCVRSYVSMYNLSFDPPSVHSMFGSSGVHSLACPFALRSTIRSFFRPYFHSRLTG